MRCEGYRRHGGAFSFGPVKWERCENDAIVNLTILHEGGETETLPACKTCWQECKDNHIAITEASPI